MQVKNIYHGEQLRNAGHDKVIIWGNGHYGKILKEQLEYRNNIIVYDNKPDGVCIELEELKNILTSEVVTIVIAIKKREAVYEVYNQLVEMGTLPQSEIYRYIPNFPFFDEVAERRKAGYDNGIKRVYPYSPEAAVELMKSAIKGTEPFLFARWGIVEAKPVFNLFYGIELEENDIRVLYRNAGFLGPLNEHGIAEFVKEYECAAKEIDILNAWFWISVEDWLFRRYSPNAKLVTSAMSYPFFEEYAWTEALSGMKVLVIHPFAELIERQYEKREVLFKCKKILPAFELKTYKAVQSMGGCEEYSSWQEALTKMKNDIKELDFDIALIGCGAYGMPLGAFIKSQLKRKAIHMGGTLQILFGIKGKRWEGEQGYNYDKCLYNEYWVRPTEDLKPRIYKEVEGGCYW